MALTIDQAGVVRSEHTAAVVASIHRAVELVVAGSAATTTPITTTLLSVTVGRATRIAITHLAFVAAGLSALLVQAGAETFLALGVVATRGAVVLVGPAGFLHTGFALLALVSGILGAGWDTGVAYDTRELVDLERTHSRLGAGVGGIAIALAAKDTVANFFGSIAIFADRPFQIDEIIKIGDHCGPVEEVGFRSTKIRTLQGHLVTIPNSVVVNTAVENIGKRPFIRRTSNITITYDAGHKKAARAVEIIKNILADVPEINTNTDRPPRVYFSDFNDWSLNIYMTYWVKPPDYWLYNEVNERVNLEMMKRFEAEQIEFAFPTQTLYVQKDPS